MSLGIKAKARSPRASPRRKLSIPKSTKGSARHDRGVSNDGYTKEEPRTAATAARAATGRARAGSSAPSSSSSDSSGSDDSDSSSASSESVSEDARPPPVVSGKGAGRNKQPSVSSTGSIGSKVIGSKVIGSKNIGTAKAPSPKSGAGRDKRREKEGRGEGVKAAVEKEAGKSTKQGKEGEPKVAQRNGSFHGDDGRRSHKPQEVSCVVGWQLVEMGHV